MATNKNSRLQELGGSGYEIVEGQPNIKGWDVKDARGNRIGEVDELIFDIQSLKVRYMVLDLEGNTFDLEPRDVLVPIGLAELHNEDDDVVLPTVTAEQLRALPEYDEDNLTPEVESPIRSVFSGTALAAGAAALSGTSPYTSSDDFYNHEHFNEDNLYKRRRKSSSTDITNVDTEGVTSIPVVEENLEIGKRTVETGGIRLRSRIIERPVEENINLREETVRVEREAVDRPATEADFKEETLEVTEKAEVPVVSKEARIVEEVTLHKEAGEREETIRDTVRSTEVDIDKLDKDNLTNKTTNNPL